MDKTSLKKTKITICHLISGDIWGGVETQVLSLLLSQINNKHLEMIVVLFNENELTHKIRSLNVKMYVVTESDHSTFKILIGLIRIFKKNKVDLVHSHGFKENLIGGVAAKLLSKKVIRTHHGKGMIPAGGIYRIIEKINNNYLTHGAIVVSQDLMQYLKHQDILHKNTNVVHNGINPDIFHKIKSKNAVRSEFNIPTDAVVIGSAGRLVPVKGYDLFIKVAYQVSKIHANTIFVLVGDGPEREKLEGLVSKYRLKNNVLLIGYKENILSYINMMDIFLLSSLHEGIPMVLLESMYSKVPIVASNVGGVPELIKNRVNGLLVSSGNIQEFVSSIVTLIEDPRLKNCLINNAEITLKDQFTVNITESKTYKMYLNCLDMG